MRKLIKFPHPDYAMLVDPFQAALKESEEKFILIKKLVTQSFFVRQ